MASFLGTVTRFVLLLAALLSLSVAAGCQSNVSSEFRKAAEQAAEAAVLTLDDLPPGWTAAPAEDNATDLKLSPRCERLFSGSEARGKVASAESDDFSGPNDERLGAVASVFSSEQRAKDALNTVRGGLSRCGDEIADALERGLREAIAEDDPDVAKAARVTVDFRELSLPNVGYPSLAYRFVGEFVFVFLKLDFTYDFVFLRAGRVAGGLSLFNLGATTIEDLRRLALLVGEKLEAADASLPNEGD